MIGITTIPFTVTVTIILGTGAIPGVLILIGTILIIHIALQLF
jgi:hypothetical protein